MSSPPPLPPGVATLPASSFLDAIPAAKPVQTALTKPQAKKRFYTKAEPWMVGVAEQAILQGNSLKHVAGLLRVALRTLMRWLEAGQDEHCEDELLVELAVTIEHARAQTAAAGMKIMVAHGQLDWRAYLEVLRAQDPETWSAQTRSKVDVNVAVSKAKDLTHLSLEQLERMHALESEAEAIRNGAPAPLYIESKS